MVLSDPNPPWAIFFVVVAMVIHLIVPTIIYVCIVLRVRKNTTTPPVIVEDTKRGSKAHKNTVPVKKRGRDETRQGLTFGKKQDQLPENVDVVGVGDDQNLDEEVPPHSEAAWQGRAGSRKPNQGRRLDDITSDGMSVAKKMREGNNNPKQWQGEDISQVVGRENRAGQNLGGANIDGVIWDNGGSAGDPGPSSEQSLVPMDGSMRKDAHWMSSPYHHKNDPRYGHVNANRILVRSADDQQEHIACPSTIGGPNDVYYQESGSGKMFGNGAAPYGGGESAGGSPSRQASFMDERESLIVMSDDEDEYPQPSGTRPPSTKSSVTTTNKLFAIASNLTSVGPGFGNSGNSGDGGNNGSGNSIGIDPESSLNTTIGSTRHNGRGTDYLAGGGPGRSGQMGLSRQFMNNSNSNNVINRSPSKSMGFRGEWGQASNRDTPPPRPPTNQSHTKMSFASSSFLSLAGNPSHSRPHSSSPSPSSQTILSASFPTTHLRSMLSKKKKGRRHQRPYEQATAAVTNPYKSSNKENEGRDPDENVKGGDESGVDGGWAEKETDRIGDLNPNLGVHLLRFKQSPNIQISGSTSTLSSMASTTKLFREAQPALLSFTDIRYSVFVRPKRRKGPTAKVSPECAGKSTTGFDGVVSKDAREGRCCLGFPFRSKSKSSAGLAPTTEGVSTKKRIRKDILKGVSGFMKPGTLCAIMGPSGCGKTTLLDILAGRKYTGNQSGEILVNGKPRDLRKFRQTSAYVMQDDALFSFLTVRETLLFTSELRISGNEVSREEKLRRVERVMADLDLTSIADKKIGDERTGGLSRGQKRRVTVAIELITFPSILFLDEPTSGLDAYSSLKLIRLLQKLAHRGGRTVICTIHQPRADIFRLFDVLYMMVAGEVAYFGTVNNIPSYFAAIGNPVPDGINPADFIVDLTHDDDGDTKSSGAGTGLGLSDEPMSFAGNKMQVGGQGQSVRAEGQSSGVLVKSLAVADPRTEYYADRRVENNELESSGSNFRGASSYRGENPSLPASSPRISHLSRAASPPGQRNMQDLVVVDMDGIGGGNPYVNNSNRGGGGAGSRSTRKGDEDLAALYDDPPASPNTLDFKKLPPINHRPGAVVAGAGVSDSDPEQSTRSPPLSPASTRSRRQQQQSGETDSRLARKASNRNSNSYGQQQQFGGERRNIEMLRSSWNYEGEASTSKAGGAELRKRPKGGALSSSTAMLQQSIKDTDSLPNQYAQSSLKTENDRELTQISQGNHPVVIRALNYETMSADEKQGVQRMYATSFITQVATIVLRCHVNSMRNAGFFVSWIVGAVSFLFYGLIYLGLRTSNLVSITQGALSNSTSSGTTTFSSTSTSPTATIEYWDSQRAFLFQIVTAIIFLQLETLTTGKIACTASLCPLHKSVVNCVNTLFYVLPEAHMEKRLFYREFASGAYSPLAYHTAWYIRISTYGLFRGLIFPPFTYFMSGLTISPIQYGVFTLIFCVMDTIGASLAFLLVCVVPTLESSSTAFTAVTSLAGTGCGFFLRPRLIPAWFLWAYYTSWYKYALDALYLNEFFGIQDPVTNQSVVEDVFEVDSRFNRWEGLLVLFAYPIAFNVIGFLGSVAYTKPRQVKN
ncbi:hypothetical protein HK102_006975 [Quaeritorhiza haematococci]|nr:hypothetical protein HK102_006975 [Quaeritorhiza haematococci]